MILKMVVDLIPTAGSIRMDQQYDVMNVQTTNRITEDNLLDLLLVVPKTVVMGSWDITTTLTIGLTAPLDFSSNTTLLKIGEAAWNLDQVMSVLS